MRKKETVKMLLSLIQEIKESDIPTNSNGSMDLKEFYKIPEVKSVIILLKMLKVDSNYLNEKGFVPASLIFGRVLNK